MHRDRATSWLRDRGIVIRLRLRRGDYVPVRPAGLQYLAFPSLRLRPPVPSHPPWEALCVVPVSTRPSIVYFSSSSSSSRFSKEERGKFRVTAAGRKDETADVMVRPREDPG